MPGPPYTLADVGCYVEEERGSYIIDRIVEIAETHGMPEPEMVGVYFAQEPYELEDECDEYMNKYHGVAGAYWGRSEQRDWGLWTNEV